MAKAPKKIGRKPQYTQWLTDKGLAQIEEWSCSGLYQQDIAAKCGVSIRSFYEWMEKFPQLLQAVKKGREVADDFVENALFKNATGYYYTEQIVVKNKVHRMLEGKSVVDEIHELMDIMKWKPAETTAQIFWLKNRRPTTWADKQEIIHNGDVTVLDPSFADEFKDQMKKRHEKATQ